MDNATFVATLIPPEFGPKSKYLVSSFNRHIDQELIGFVLKDEEPDFTQQDMEYFEEHTSKLIVGREDSGLEYGPLVQLEGLRQAVQHTDSEWIISIDTDLLFVGPFDPQISSDTDIAATAMDLGNKYWGWEESRSGWTQLHEMYDVPMPGESTTTLADNYETVHPLYSTGVVVIHRDIAAGLVSRWKEMTVELYSQLPDLFGHFNSWFTEQAVFDVLSCDYNMQELPPDYNFPLNTLAYAPKSVRVLHYHDFKRFRTPMHPSVWKEVKRSGVLADSPRHGIAHSLYTPAQIKLRSAWKKYILRK